MRWLIPFVFALQCATIYGQGWQHIYPPEELNELTSAVWWNGDTAFAGGSNWTLLRTTDAGTTWKTVLHNEYPYNIKTIVSNGDKLILQAVPSFQSTPRKAEDSTFMLYSYDLRTGAFQEYPCYIGESIDGISSYPVAANLHYIYQRGSASKAWRSIIKIDLVTRDTVKLSFPCEVEAVACAGDSMVFVTGNYYLDGQYIQLFGRSMNHGRSWEYDTIPGPISVDNNSSIACVEEKSFMRCIFSKDGNVWTSDDSARTWRRTNQIPWPGGWGYEIQRVIPVDADTWFVSSRNGSVVGTVDAGNSWVIYKQPEKSSDRFLQTAMDFAAGRNGAMILTSGDGYICQSADGGLTWDYRKRFDICEFIDVHFFDAQSGVSLGRNIYGESASYRTIDGGSSWEMRGTCPFQPYQLLYESYGRISGYRLTGDTIKRFQFYTTSNQGKDWILEYESDIGADPSMLFAFGDYFVFPTTTSATIGGTYWSIDRGRTWHFNKGLPASYSPREIQCVYDDAGNLDCFAILANTKKNYIVRSADSCKSWAPFWWNGSEAANSEFHVVNKDTIVLRRDADIYLITSGGTDVRQFRQPVFPNNLWTNIYYLPTIYTIQDVMRVSRTDDYWSSSSEQLQHSLNKYIQTPTASFLDRDHGWIACGPNLYRTSTGGVNHIQSLSSAIANAGIRCIYPNPVNIGQTVTIQFETGEMNRVAVLTVSDLLGRKVAEYQIHDTGAGVTSIHWKPAGVSAPGIYHVTLTTSGIIHSKQLVVIK